MTLSGKQQGELMKLFYLSGENATEAVRVYGRNHMLEQGLCSIKTVHNLVMNFEETGWTCDRPLSGRSRVPVEVVAEMHNMITTGSLHTARSVSRNLNVPKIIVLQILLSVLRMFLYRFQRIQALEPADNQQLVDFAGFLSLNTMKMADEDDCCKYYGKMRHISPLLRT